jgi:hypothetical protein
MKNYLNTFCGGFTYNVKVCESAQEWDTVAAKPGSCVETANTAEIYNAINPEARGILVSLLVAETKISRKMVQAKKDGQPLVKDGKPVLIPDETEAEYIKRALATTGKKPADFQAAFDKAVAAANDGKGLAVDPKEAERKARAPQKLPGEYLQMAKNMLAPEGAELFKKFKTTLFTKITGQPFPTLPADTAQVPEALGWIIREWWLAKEKKEKAEMFGS